MANNFETLIEAFAAQIQDLETVWLELLNATRLDQAVGVQLDRIGVVVGIARGNADDDRYRDLIAAQISTNLASGTIEELLVIVGLIVGPTVELALTEYFPAGFEIEAVDEILPAGQGAAVALLVKSAKAAAVKGLFRWYETDPLFRLDGAGGAVFDGGYFFSTSL